MAVVKELEHLRKDANVGGLATTALADLAWLGDPIVLDEDAGREAERLRNIIAAGRPLTHDLQHYAEAALIVVGRPIGAQAIIEDYDARVAAQGNGVRPMSVHKLLRSLDQAGCAHLRSGVRVLRGDPVCQAGPRLHEEELIEGGRRLGRSVSRNDRKPATSRVEPLPAGRTDSPSLAYSFRLLHPTAIPRTPPFTAVRRRVDDSLTCHDPPPWFTQVQQNHVRNMEVGGSSPLTSACVFRTNAS